MNVAALLHERIVDETDAVRMPREENDVVLQSLPEPGLNG
jgi:hypothetical protein